MHLLGLINSNHDSTFSNWNQKMSFVLSCCSLYDNAQGVEFTDWVHI